MHNNQNYPPTNNNPYDYPPHNNNNNNNNYNNNKNIVQQGAPMPQHHDHIIIMQGQLPKSADGHKHSTAVQCPNCGYKGITRVDHHVGGQTICCSIIIFILFWPLFFLPCFMRSCKNADHYCCNCGQYVGSSKYSIC
ncbi:hypothetical protein PPERSA_02048 [Pseudocohnilembus persalinus]|uniref:LITAF domain-containing protein n=1 Tax=Pseudocohnilembus persalinus TaxID=266149 RepID=A0A0V0QFE3_PSEPJ|nr:hypothetical protein PPERSA_02048 [Pseudocohnilembus persalinus]|eukprot:KRX00869.1 hypothetical protein PPERSA_02048 [Pseudocohnilembus persalinus]